MNARYASVPLYVLELLVDVARAAVEYEDTQPNRIWRLDGAGERLHCAIQDMQDSDALAAALALIRRMSS